MTRTMLAKTTTQACRDKKPCLHKLQTRFKRGWHIETMDARLKCTGTVSPLNTPAQTRIAEGRDQACQRETRLAENKS